MVSLENLYNVLKETVPLYFAMILGYLSIKWWKLFTPEQCAGVNKFVSKFSIPLLSFQFIAANNPYQMNFKLILSDVLQKSLSFFVFLFAANIFCGKSMDWIITGISISTLPNTLIVGIPLLRGMYGEEAVRLITQIVVLQSMVWYNVLLFFFEFRAQKVISSEAATTTQVTGKWSSHLISSYTKPILILKIKYTELQTLLNKSLTKWAFLFDIPKTWLKFLKPKKYEKRCRLLIVSN